MIVEYTAKNSGGIIAVETDRVVIRGRLVKPILYSSCHGDRVVEAELVIEQDPDGLVTTTTLTLQNGK